MSVSSTSTKIQYTGDGSTTNFSFPFNLLTDANASVTISPTDVTIYFGAAGSEVVQSSTLYTVNGPSASPANTIIFNSAPASGTIITIERVKALTQSSRFIDNQPFPASSFELALDKLTMEVQQLQEQLNRSIELYPATTLSGPINMQDLLANNYLTVDPTGTKIVMATGANLAGGAPPQDTGSAAPTTGTYAKGWIRWSTNPSAGGTMGWICVTAGTPGTWKTFGVISL